MPSLSLYRELTPSSINRAALDVPLWQLFASPSEVAQSLGGVDGATDGVVRCPQCGKCFKVVPLED